MENVMSNRYLYGNGTRFWKQDDLLDMSNIDHDTPGVKSRGLISMLVPNAHSIVEANPISLTGAFLRDNVADGETHFEGATWYKNFYGWKDSTNLDDSELIQYNVENREINSVCWQGHQFSYNQTTKGFTSVTRNSGRKYSVV